MHEKTNVFFHIVKYEDRKRLGNNIQNLDFVVLQNIALFKWVVFGGNSYGGQQKQAKAAQQAQCRRITNLGFYVRHEVVSAFVTTE